MNIRLLLVAIGLLAAYHSRAQTSWCPPGAIWQYQNVAMGGTAPTTMRYVGDTLVSGHQCQVLRHYDAAVPPLITRGSNDSIFFWHDNRFVLLYRFNAQPGESWQTYAAHAYGVCPQIPVQFTVDTVGTLAVGGRSIRWLALRAASGIYSGNWGRIYEGIGGVYAFQPHAIGCGGTDPDLIMNLRSFQATGWPTIGQGGFNGTLHVLATAEARAAQAGFTAAPNPSTGLLTLQLPATHRAAQLTLHDLTGRRVWQQAAPANQQLDLGHLPRGLYVLTAESAGHAPLSRRVVLQ